MAIINLSDVSYLYPLTDTPALSDINLVVEEGEFVAVIGPNGAGKSTLCYTIAGFIPHFFQGDLSGPVLVAGIDSHTSSLQDLILKVGLVFQNPFNQISGAKFTVYEELAFGLENMGVPRSEMPERVKKAMQLTGISDLGERSPYSLSGGQQQRVALASILVMQPEVLVLDEPTSQLDPIGTREVFQIIKQMSAQGMTVVMAEHKVEWIAEFADRVILLHEGKIALQGAPQEVLTNPLLERIGAVQSRYTIVARQAKNNHLWPKTRILPVTLEQAAAGFEEQLDADKN